MKAAEELGQQVGVAPACRALSVSRATLYRTRARLDEPCAPQVKRVSHRALSDEERGRVLMVLNSERFCDMAPAAIYATLLDEDGIRLCSVSTMYRILTDAREVKERRNQLRHPVYTKPELLAVKPNSVWSWDITKLKGPAKWTYYHLYVILDIYSRYVVGWMIATEETAALAKKLIDHTCTKQEIEKDQLVLHADRGSSMKSKPVYMLLTDLGVTKSHSRPYTSTDNPYSEAQFKTLKYRPEFPKTFGSIQDARAFCHDFFTWYNQKHRHSGIAYLTPEMVHYGHATEVINARRLVLDKAYDDHPERFVRGAPGPQELPGAVWINKPVREDESEVVLH